MKNTTKIAKHVYLLAFVFPCLMTLIGTRRNRLSYPCKWYKCFAACYQYDVHKFLKSAIFIKNDQLMIKLFYCLPVKLDSFSLNSTPSSDISPRIGYFSSFSRPQQRQIAAIINFCFLPAFIDANLEFISLLSYVILVTIQFKICQESSTGLVIYSISVFISS